MEKNEDITGYIVDKNISIAGSVDGSKENYREAIEFISSNKNRFPFKDLITGIGSPENIDKIAKKDKNEIKYIIKW
jgi:Threonine dehydrogenase and related Zn-dependent dehydrogenases